MLRDRPSLHIDFETFSDVNLITCGSSVYSHRAVPILMGLKLEDGPTTVYDYRERFNDGMDDFGDWCTDYDPDCPDILRDAIRERWWIVAHNAPFEYHILQNSPALSNWPKPAISQIICTQAKCRYMGIPSSLEAAGKTLALDIQKDKRGSALIKKFCVPQKAGRGKNASTIIRRIKDDDDWQAFKEYNRDDVETEYLIDEALPDIPDRFRKYYYMHFRMEERGFPVDIPSVKKAQDYYSYFYKQMDKRFKQLSKGLAPTQVAKIKEMLNDDFLMDFDNLQSTTIRDTLLDSNVGPNVREMLEIRQQAAQASVKKLTAFINRTDADNRARGGFLWYGAHTGRTSGKGIQPQNFPRGVKALMKYVKGFFKVLASEGGIGTAELIYPKPLGVLSSALRGFIQAPPGKKFVIVDYAQIELRVLAWLAGAEKTLQRLREGIDPYKAFAAEKMYDCDVSEIDDYKRQIAKSALLGAQYQIWIDAFIEYCAKVANIKISKEEATNAVLAYRSDNPEIVEFWSDINEAIISAVEQQGESRLNNLIIRYEKINGYEWLRIYLPSGRPISYFEPKVSWRTSQHEAKDKEGNVIIGEDGNPVMYERTRKVFSFLTEDGGRIHREYTYGGKECIAHDTVVVTDNGFKYIQDVLLADRLWDGYSWVGHDGLVCKGEQHTIEAFNVRMTPDHEVLTTEGWKSASQSQGHNRASCRVPYGAGVRRVERDKIVVERKMRLRRNSHFTCRRASKAAKTWNNFVMWVHAIQNRIRENYNTWHDLASGFRCLALHERPLQVAYASSLAQLRWTRNTGLQRMASVVRGVLGRYGADLSTGVDARPYRQQSRLPQRELPMGNVFGASAEHEALEKVYDIVNAGPLRRFTVIDSEGVPLIVHNCENVVQGIAADIMWEGLLIAEENGYWPIAAVHDEGVTEVDEDFGSVHELEQLVCELPACYDGLPMAAEGFECVRYRKG